MRLISVEKDELIVGRPLPFALYDLKRNVVMDRGAVIDDAAHLKLIMDNNPLRELSARTEYDNAAASRPAAESNSSIASSLSNAMPAMSNHIASNNASETPVRAMEKSVEKTAERPIERPVERSSDKSGEKTSDSNFTFLDMKLRVGDRIQLQLPASMGSDRYVVRLIGYVENGSVLVTPPVANGMSLPVRMGDKVVARVFTSQTAFAFDSTIERVSKIPYDYLHLYYPPVVQGAVVRQAPRIKTRIIASVAVGTGNAAEDKMSAVIVNISAQGALISTRQPLDKQTHQITVSFRINLHGMDTHLNLKAVIRSVQVDDKESTDPLKYHHGIQFLYLQANENMILQSLIYQQMIEFPQNLM